MFIKGGTGGFKLGKSWLGGSDMELFPLSGVFLNEYSRYTIKANYRDDNAIYSVGKRIKTIVEILTEISCYRYLVCSNKKGYENVYFNRNIITDNRDNKIMFLVAIKNVEKCAEYKLKSSGNLHIPTMYYDNLVILINKNFSKLHPIVYKDFIKHILPSYPEEAEIRFLNEIESSIFISKKTEEFYSCLDTLEDKIKTVSKDISLKIFGNNADIDLRLENAINKKLSETDDPSIWKEFGKVFEKQEDEDFSLEVQLLSGSGYAEVIEIVEEDVPTSTENSQIPIEDPLGNIVPIEAVEVSANTVTQGITFIDDLSVETVPVTFIDDLTQNTW